MKRKNILNCIIILLVITLATVSFFGLKQRNKLYAKDLCDYNDWVSKNDSNNITDDSSNLGENSFYEKINANKDVSILLIGDELTLGKTANDTTNYTLDKNLSSWIKEKYKVNSNFQFVEEEKADITKVITLFDDNVNAKDYDLVILSLGLNDFNEKTQADTFAQYYTNLIGKIRSRNYKCFIIALLPPLDSDNNEYNSKIKSVCSLNNVCYIDILNEFKSSNDELSTLINNIPTTQGYSIIEAAIKKSILIK